MRVCGVISVSFLLIFLEIFRASISSVARFLELCFSRNLFLLTIQNS